MKGVPDSYEWYARLLPTFIITSPIFIILAIWTFSISPALIGFVATGLLFLSFLYIFSFLIRHFGKKAEAKLWILWGGPPSTTLMHPDNPTFEEDIKKSIIEALQCRFSIELIGLQSPDWDQRIEAAFRLVRQRIRQRDPNGLWYKHLAEYGFMRNLYACVSLWIIMGILGLVISLGLYIYSENNWYAFAAAWGAISILIAVLCHRYILPKPLLTAAERYAENAWLSFLYLESKD